ncbi:MAG: rhamnulokinase, partial [Armatimonadota bacterium]
MSGKNFLAFDLGAESGRTILGTLDNGKIEIRELNRFPTGMTNLRGKLVWNVIGFYEKMKEGLKACAAEGITEPDGIAVDTWGVDFVLLDRDGNPAGVPIAYRDSRTDGMMEEFFKVMPEDKLYSLTGIQMMQLNSLIQLFAMVREKSPQLDIAHDLIFIPDYFTYLFTGKKISEFSIASTSQMYNPISKQWDQEVLDAAGISADLMRYIVPAGTYVGELDPVICRETGIKSAKVIATAGHDTGSAIAAAPAVGSGWAYISSGTWSLMGIESDYPILTEKAHEYNFSNEGGVGGTARVLKNIMGLWLIQQCRKSWSREKTYSYGELTLMAEASEPFRSIINPDFNKFLNPADMPHAIDEYCENT